MFYCSYYESSRSRWRRLKWPLVFIHCFGLQWNSFCGAIPWTEWKIQLRAFAEAIKNSICKHWYTYRQTLIYRHTLIGKHLYTRLNLSNTCPFFHFEGKKQSFKRGRVRVEQNFQLFQNYGTSTKVYKVHLDAYQRILTYTWTPANT